MNSAILLPFIGGFGVALVFGAVARILLGMRLHLQLVNADSPVRDQAVIPVTSENKKGLSLLHTLLTGNWREDVEIVLADHANHHYSFIVGYHLWWRFYLVSHSDNKVLINHKNLKKMKRYYLKTGQFLKVGDRAFTVLITTSDVRPTLHKELAAHFEETSSDIDL